MYDKTVRRRRAVLALLVVLSLLLLTAYFGESSGGGLHGVQRTFLTVVSPIQDGANKALKPVRDLFGWFGDTFHAKGQRDELRKQIDHLRPELVAAQAEKRSTSSCSRSTTSTSWGSALSPRARHRRRQKPHLWYSTVTIDKGTPTASGQRPGRQRRRAGRQGRRGRVRRRPVDLITDSSKSASRHGSDATQRDRDVQPKVGDPNDLLLQYLPANRRPTAANTSSPRARSPAPTTRSIRRASRSARSTRVDEESAYKSVNVQPLANLRNLDVVQVLTAPPARRAGTEHR